MDYVQHNISAIYIRQILGNNTNNGARCHVLPLSPVHINRQIETCSTWFTWQEHNSSGRVGFVLAKVECPKFAFHFLYSYGKCWALYLSWGTSECQSLGWANSEGGRKHTAFIVLEVIDLQRDSSLIVFICFCRNGLSSSFVVFVMLQSPGFPSPTQKSLRLHFSVSIASWSVMSHHARCWSRVKGIALSFPCTQAALTLILWLSCLLDDHLHFSRIVFIQIVFQMHLRYLIINNKHLLNIYGLWIRIWATNWG